MKTGNKKKKKKRQKKITNKGKSEEGKMDKHRKDVI